MDQVVDPAVPVLDAGVGEDHRRATAALAAPSGLDEDGDGVAGIKTIRKPPGEDSPGEVVDDGVEVAAGSVEELDHSGVDVPYLIRPQRTDADLGLRGVKPKPWPTPSPVPDQPMPGRSRSEDAAHPLREHSERSRRHVTVVPRGDHVVDASNLIGGEAVRRGLRTGGLVLELARKLRALPREVTGSGQANDPQGLADADEAARPMDRPNEPALRLDGHALVVKPGGASMEKGERDPEKCREPDDASPQPDDLGADIGISWAHGREGDDGDLGTAEPPGGGGPGNAGAGRDRDVGRGSDEFSEAMVVSPLPAVGCH